MTQHLIKNISLRARIMASVLLITTAGFITVIVTAWIFHDVSYNNQKDALTELVGLKVSNQLNDLGEMTKNLGLEIQTQTELRSAILNRDIKTIQTILDSQFRRYFITAEKLKLIDIVTFDKAMNYITDSTRGIKNASPYSYCDQLINFARQRSGVERLKPISQLCEGNGVAQFGMLVPVDSLNPFAYLLLVADPAHNISQIDITLGDPIKIVRPDKEIVYTSNIWPEKSQVSDYLITNFTIRNNNGDELLTVYAARDIEPYRSQLIDKTILILLFCMFFFAPLVLVIILTLRKSLIPLNDLQSAASQLTSGKFVQVKTTDVPEMNVLVQSFNHMASEISKLINKLQTEIFQHQNTEERLRKNQADLSLARDQAFAASRAKSAFLANMSHELRTPLNAILGYCEILCEENENTENKQLLEDLKNINQAGKHLLGLIDDILDLSKIESGELDLHLETFDIKSFVDDAVGYVQHIKVKNNNNLAVQCEANIGTMFCDAVKLRQSLINILDNACKFTENGDIVLMVSRESRNNQDWIHFSVSDTGIGISESQSKRLFSEFTQLDSSSTKAYGGAGLGLLLSQRFCELMGGHITFSSEINKGSVFSILVPRNCKHSAGFSKHRDYTNGDISKSA